MKVKKMMLSLLTSAFVLILLTCTVGVDGSQYYPDKNIEDNVSSVDATVEQMQFRPEDVQEEQFSASISDKIEETISMEIIPEETSPQIEDGFSDVNETVYATTGVNIRTAPDTDSEIIDSLDICEGILRVGTNEDGWSKVVLGENYYYIRSSYLSETPYESVIVNHDVWYRSGGGMDCDILGTLYKGEILYRLENNGSWSKVIYKGQEVYVGSKYLTAITNNNYTKVNEIVKATVIVNVRAGAGTNFDIVGGLNVGETVRRVGIGENGWSKVIFNNKEAYIKSTYLTK